MNIVQIPPSPSPTPIDESETLILSRKYQLPTELMPTVKKLDTLQFSHFKDKHLSRLLPLLPSLEEIDLTGSEITNLGLKTLSETCKGLTTLNLNQCHLISSQGLEKVLEANPLLSSLSFAGNLKITALFQTVVRRGPHLSAFTPYSLTCFEVQQVGLTFTQLRYLDLSNSHLCKRPAKPERDGWRVDDKAALSIAQNCNSLVTLKLSNIDLITSTAIGALLSSCSQLEELNLSGCEEIDGYWTGEVANNTSLKKLDLSHCNDLFLTAIRYLTLSCKNLESLHLDGSKYLNKRSLQEIAQNCPQIKKLSIVNCPEVTNECFPLLTGSFPNLLFLDLHGNRPSYQSTFSPPLFEID